MTKLAPNRLLNETFFKDGLQIRLHHHVLHQTYQLHWHEFYELTVILSGRGTNTVNGVCRAIQPGDAFLLTPADFHEIAPDTGPALTHFNLIFSQGMLSDDMVRLLFSGSGGRYARFDVAKDFEALVFRFESLMTECETPDVGQPIALVSELNRILIAWHRMRSSASDEKQADVNLQLRNHHHPGIQKSLLYIQHHFRQPLSLQDAADHAHLSTNYFSELFSKATGITFQQYVLQLRLQFAQSLLQSSALPVTEVSYVSGFNTLTHFERAFRLQFGMTPSETQRRRAKRDASSAISPDN